MALSRRRSFHKILSENASSNLRLIRQQWEKYWDSQDDETARYEEGVAKGYWPEIS